MPCCLGQTKYQHILVKNAQGRAQAWKARYKAEITQGIFCYC